MPLFGPPNIEKMTAQRDVNGLIKALGHKDASIRATAAKALGTLGDKQALVSLIALLKDEQDDVRQGAAEALGKIIPTVEALGKIGDARAVEPLSKIVLSSPSAYMQDLRPAAACALGKIGDQRAIEPLLTALKNGVRQAADALDQLGWQPGEDETAAWYWLAREQLEQCEQLGEVAVEALIAALGRSKEAFHSKIVSTLGKIGGARVVPPLIAELNRDAVVISHDAGYALTCIGEAAVEPLIAVIKSARGSWSLRCAADALGRIGDPRAVAPLIDLSHHTLVEVRYSSAEALRDMGDVAVEGLLTALKDKDWHIRETAARALGRPDNQRAVEPLIAALGDEHPFIRLSAAGSLGRIGDERAIEPLFDTTLNDSDEKVRNTATDALKRFEV